MYLVFDVGATFIKYALMDDEGNISGKGKTPTDRYAEAGTPAFVAQIKKVYDEKVLDCDITGIKRGGGRKAGRVNRRITWKSGDSFHSGSSRGL